jgi:hypothetical protein
LPQRLQTKRGSRSDSLIFIRPPIAADHGVMAAMIV